MNVAAVQSLKASSDFQRVSRLGKKWVTPAYILLLLREEKDSPLRLGLTASRKVGNAVIRNRAKRRLREMVRATIKEGQMRGYDMVLIAKTAAATYDLAKMKGDMVRGLIKLEALT